MKKLFITIVLITYYLGVQSQMNLNKVGQKAPEINIGSWIYPKIQVADWQNKKVPEDLNGKVIVLDFWFIHCAPCVASIPELNHLARQFPEIVFLSVTFDKPGDINNFLDKMVMYYPVGSDPEQETIRAFGVTGFPETFLIDENGIIVWQGSPFHLDNKIINKAIGNKTQTNNLNHYVSESLIENSAYSFTIHKHSLDMGPSSYYHFNPYDINVFNKDLENMLNVFYGINKSRILTQDSALLKTTYDLTLKADKEITSQANCFEMLKFLLPEQMGFNLKEILKDTLANVLHIENEALLQSHTSGSEHFATTMRYDNWEAKGATMRKLMDFLEDNYSELLVFEEKYDKKFDFTIPAKDFMKAKEVLQQDYGLILEKKLRTISMWKIMKEDDLGNKSVK